ncbi:Os12g0226500, partial [Oryza sativa Japonica Group]
DELLANIEAVVDPNECRRRRIEPLDNVLQIGHLPFPQIPGHLLLKLAVYGDRIEYHEPLHPQSLGDDVHEVTHPLRPFQVVL